MKRFKITLLVPHTHEVVVADAQAAHNEASRLATAPLQGDVAARIHSIEEIEDVETEPLHFDTQS